MELHIAVHEDDLQPDASRTFLHAGPWTSLTSLSFVNIAVSTAVHVNVFAISWGVDMVSIFQMEFAEVTAIAIARNIC